MFSGAGSLALRMLVVTPATAKMTPTTIVMSPIGPDLPGVLAMTSPSARPVDSASLGARTWAAGHPHWVSRLPARTSTSVVRGGPRPEPATGDPRTVPFSAWATSVAGIRRGRKETTVGDQGG